MPILALDTATMVSSVAIASPDKLLAEVTLQTKLTHSEVLMPHVYQSFRNKKFGRLHSLFLYHELKCHFPVKQNKH